MEWVPSFIINVAHKLIHEFEIVFSRSVGVDLFDGIDFKLASGHISSVNPLLSSDVENILSSEQLSEFCCEIRACVARLRTEGFENSCCDVIDFGAQWVSDARFDSI